MRQIYLNDVQELTGYDIPPYHESKDNIPKDGFQLVHKLLNFCIPESQKDTLSNDNISIHHNFFLKQRTKINIRSKSITFKGLSSTEEQRRDYAFFLGTLLASETSGNVIQEELTSDDQETINKINSVPFRESFDLKFFFGYLFEYLYLVEKAKDDERRLGLVVSSQNAEDNALDIFRVKHLNRIKHLSEMYIKKREELCVKLLEQGEKNDKMNSHTETVEAVDNDFEAFASDYESMISSFNSALSFILLRYNEEVELTDMDFKRIIGLFFKNPSFIDKLKNKRGSLIEDFEDIRKFMIEHIEKNPDVIFHLHK